MNIDQILHAAKKICVHFKLDAHVCVNYLHRKEEKKKKKTTYVEGKKPPRMNRKINTFTCRKILRLPARRFMPVRRRLKRFTTLNNLDYNRARRSARRCVSSRISWDPVTRKILLLLTWLNRSAQSYFKPLLGPLVRWSTDDFIKNDTRLYRTVSRGCRTISANY